MQAYTSIIFSELLGSPLHMMEGSPLHLMDVFDVLNDLSPQLRPILPKGKKKTICNTKTCIGVKLTVALRSLSEFQEEHGVNILSKHKNVQCSGFPKRRSLDTYLNNTFTASFEQHRNIHKQICDKRGVDFPWGGIIVLILKLDQKLLAELDRLEIAPNNKGMCFPIARLGVLQQYQDLVNDVVVLCVDKEHFPTGKYALKKHNDSLTN